MRREDGWVIEVINDVDKMLFKGGFYSKLVVMLM